MRAFTECTEIPDTFPSAVELRRAGYTTYLAIFRVPAEELAALGISSEVVASVLAFQRADEAPRNASRKPDKLSVG